MPKSLQGFSKEKQLQGFSKEKEIEKKKQVGRGSNPLSVAKELMKSQDNWQEVISKEQYQFPAVSINAQGNTLLCTAVTSCLSSYVVSKPHFLWEDIQLSKGKLNPDRAITININGKDEADFYRTAPCNGVKVCSALDCPHIQPLVQSTQLPQQATPLIVQWCTCTSFHKTSLMIIEGKHYTY